jgi:hypothetical protein
VFSVSFSVSFFAKLVRSQGLASVVEVGDPVASTQRHVSDRASGLRKNTHAHTHTHTRTHAHRHTHTFCLSSFLPFVPSLFWQLTNFLEARNACTLLTKVANKGVGVLSLRHLFAVLKRF